MNAIWKYKLDIVDNQILSIPKRAKPLCVGVQNNVPVIWVLVEAVLSDIDYKIRTVGTGHKFFDSTSGDYVGTYQIKTGKSEFVGHVFFKEARNERKEL